MFPTSMGSYKEQMHYDGPYEGYPYDERRELNRPTMMDQRTDSYESRPGDEDESGIDRAAKRYPCRYRDSHGCEKTFTTSGHASRHSKIHTAEKAVHCTFENCNKKFTRSDNMKQHLETHNKEKDRRGSGHKSSGSRSGLTISAGVKKAASAKKNTQSPSQISRPEFPSSYSAPDVHGSYEHYGAGSQPSSYSAFEMNGFCNVLMSRPMAARTDSSNAGLDVLAQAAASVPDLSPHSMQ